jgi:hypothetical protein
MFFFRKGDFKADGSRRRAGILNRAGRTGEVDKRRGTGVFYKISL